MSRAIWVGTWAWLTVLLCVVSPAGATVFTVTNTNDAGANSLRAAILSANANAGSDQIVFGAGVTGTISLASTLSITDELIITGPGARLMTISGGDATRILDVTAPATLSRLRLADGFAAGGAGIRYDASGLLSVVDCHFDQNLATTDGGAIQVLQGSLSAQRCTFTTNQAAGNGGVIAYGQGGGTPTATITNCTFVNSFASQLGGAIRQAGTTAYAAAVTNCTFVVNNAGTGGGAIALNGGTMTLLNDLFTANGAGGNPGGHLRESGGTFTSLGNNLFGHLDGTTFTPASSDRFGTVAAQLNNGVLIAFPSDNGGLTDTLTLLATSIAIDGGGTTGAPAGDQRDFPRVGCAPDVGAFEVQTLTDTDSDGVINCIDDCPGTPTCASVDQTGCPTDSDDDGVSDGCDGCPGSRIGDVDANGCSTDDDDGDGVLNDVDRCRGTQPCAIASVDVFGCPTDADADGVFDGCDLCAGAPDDLDDTDTDGVVDCLDACAGTATCAAVDQSGCPTDFDADAVVDGCDQCPTSRAGDDVDADGCSTDDDDGDGTPNDADACGGTQACARASVDASGCPADADSDGVFDGCDLCPGESDLTDTDDDDVPDCLTPVCREDTDCDDGDACTDDVCTAAGCEQAAAGGLTGAECALAAALSEPLCPAGTIDADLAQFAATKLQRARELVRKAASSTKPKQRQRLLQKARVVLGKVLRRPAGTTSADCARGLTTLIDDVLAMLA